MIGGSTIEIAINSDGSLAEPYTQTLPDNSVSLTISAGTIISADGEIPDRIVIEPASLLGQQPVIPNDWQPVSKLYTLVAYIGNRELAHTVFSQPFLLTIHCDTTNIPNGSSVSMAYYETTTGWVSVNSTFDAETGNVSAYINHFTVFAGMIKKGQNLWLGLASIFGALIIVGLLFYLFFIFKLRKVLVFITPVQKVRVGEVSDTITVQVRNRRGKPYNMRKNVIIQLHSDSPTGKFDVSPSGGFVNQLNEIIVPKGQNSAILYYKDISAGVHTLMIKKQIGIHWKIDKQKINIYQ
jgi:hypothetical protein